ncbi:MAG: DEAD/DEAH box helicase family protein, partial [Candidatus Thorarchaeota archaeon]
MNTGGSEGGANRWGLDSIYYERFYNWDDLERTISDIDDSKRKGDAFEQFCYFYFLYHKDLYDIEEVWCDKIEDRQIPLALRDEFHLEKSDFGVDGLSRLRSGEIEAWQAKFRSNRESPSFRELSTFWAEAEYTDYRRVIANSETLPAVSEKKAGHQQTLVDSFISLDERFFNALYDFATEISGIFRREKYRPRRHQTAMIEDVVKGLLIEKRGKMIAAPGTGKTLAALWITEHDDLSFSRVLVLVPSIALVGQTLRQWTMHRRKDFSYLCVCSDAGVESQASEIYDITPTELGIHVTTRSEEIASWLDSTASKRQYVFSTYHSIEAIAQAIDALNYKFDLIVFDEAHRTVGRADQLFSLALIDDVVPSRKRLFMTATERIVNPRTRAIAADYGYEVFSMCDEETYGPVLHEYRFDQAIVDGVIADYEIVLAEVSGQDIRTLMEANRRLTVEFAQEGIGEIGLSADQLFKAGYLMNALSWDEVNKVLSFHSLRNRAERFCWLIQILANEIESVRKKSPFISYVLGTHNMAERGKRILSFENAEIGVLSNVQVLSEGVDIPLIDSVYFVDPKTSVVDIVQAIGRALRKPYGQEESKVARIMIPVIIPEGVETPDCIDWEYTLRTLHYVLQAMRAQDIRLEEEINQINLYEATNGNEGWRVGARGKIRIDAPTLELDHRIDLNSFLNGINLRIAIVNANPEGTKLGFSFLGKGERKSEYKPIFSILGDYNPEVYWAKLVAPTLARFSSVSLEIPRSDLKINHNNVSHTERLGLITESSKNVM